MCILSGVNFDTVVAMVDWTLGDPAVLVSLPSSQPLRWDFIPPEDILWLINERERMKLFPENTKKLIHLMFFNLLN